MFAADEVLRFSADMFDIPKPAEASIPPAASL
jgi:hypothetical protein